MEEFVLIEKKFDIIPIDQFEKLKIKSEDEKLPTTTDIKDWLNIKNLPKLLNKSLSRSFQNGKEIIDFTQNLPTKPTIVSASIDQANYLLNHARPDLFFGGRFWTQVEINNIILGFSHEGILSLHDIYFRNIFIDREKTTNYDIYLGYGFEKVLNENYIFKWGNYITNDDIQKRNRDIYQIKDGCISLINFTKSDD